MNELDSVERLLQVVRDEQALRGKLLDMVEFYRAESIKLRTEVERRMTVGIEVAALEEDLDKAQKEIRALQASLDAALETIDEREIWIEELRDRDRQFKEDLCPACKPSDFRAEGCGEDLAVSSSRASVPKLQAKIKLLEAEVAKLRKERAERPAAAPTNDLEHPFQGT